jgi:hypothetical protein
VAVENTPQCPVAMPTSVQLRPWLCYRICMYKREKDSAMPARYRFAVFAAVGAGVLGLLGCGSSGRRQAMTKRAISTPSAPEFAVVEAQHEAAFATFGERASHIESTAIIAELHSYYSALAEGHFERGCSLLSRKARAQVANMPGEDSGAIEHSCGKRLGEVLARTIGERNERSQFTVASAKEVRLKGGEGYVVFTTAATSAEQHALSVIREGGSWHVISTIALPILYATPTAVMQ